MDMQPELYCYEDLSHLYRCRRQRFVTSGEWDAMYQETGTVSDAVIDLVDWSDPASIVADKQLFDNLSLDAKDLWALFTTPPPTLRYEMYNCDGRLRKAPVRAHVRDVFGWNEERYRQAMEELHDVWKSLR